MPARLMAVQALSTAQRMGAAQQMPLNMPAETFHPVNQGVDFAAAYRLGMRGSFESFTPLPCWKKALWCVMRSTKHKWDLLTRGFRRKPQFFVLW